jgi:hypothetical protein
MRQDGSKSLKEQERRQENCRFPVCCLKFEKKRLRLPIKTVYIPATGRDNGLAKDAVPHT